jgi:hypothetical protein
MELPDFDYLKSLADTDPQELEKLRRRYSQQIIESAPEHFQKRLNCLLFQINMEKRRSKNSIHSCITLSKMMMDSYVGLQDAMVDFCDQKTIEVQSENKIMGKVIGFPNTEKSDSA